MRAEGQRTATSRMDPGATHLVIQGRGKAQEALEWTCGVLEGLGLTLKEKRSMRNARQERFDFLWYTCGPHISPRGGSRYIGYSPSKKSVSRIKQKAGEQSCRA